MEIQNKTKSWVSGLEIERKSEHNKQNLHI